MNFWFEPVEPLNLGLCRVLFFGAFFLFYLPQDFSAWAEVSDSFWMPIALFEILHLPVVSSGVLAMLQSIWKVSLALSSLGLFTRVSTASSFILGVYLLGLPHNFGKTHHFDAIVVIALGIMALSRCGDGFSVDRLIRRAYQGSRPSGRNPRMSGEYTWPVRAVWLMLALIFFAAGVSKLRHSALEWIFSDNMAIMLVQQYYFISNADPLVPWGLALAQYGWLTRLIAAATVTFEISYPLALFSSRARWIIVPSILVMQVGIRVLMGPTFPQFLICNLFWVRWDYAGQRLASGFYSLLSLSKHLRPPGEESSSEALPDRICQAPAGAERLIGEVGVVKRPIGTGFPGWVFVHGELWRAMVAVAPEDSYEGDHKQAIKVGRKVQVVEIRDGKVVVLPLESDAFGRPVES